jgi:CubicO group peptidase (beta-lactamase class C family)
MRAVAVLTVVLAYPAPLSAQDPEAPGSVNPSALTAFVDEFFPQEMARRRIPGLVFVFVSGGEIALARGFGVAQLEPRRPVDPDRTVFRLASVSKTVTATAALQLVERGRLDLQTDVNTYLKSFQLAARHGPITLNHLLTHTAGFDERLLGAGARSAQDVEPSSRYLARSMPPTFMEPGRVISYSNHGYALVGHLVEEVSGRPFADYVRAEIFEPLGMWRSGSLTGQVPEDLAVAYEYEEGQHRALSPEYLQISSAGFFFTTGTDMGRFVIAHLRGGAYRERRILRPETVALMHTRHFAQTPATSGWAYGLWEDTRGGRRALLHDGGGKGYKALIYLVPHLDVGFFLAYNLADSHKDGVLHDIFVTRFRHEFVPTQDATHEPIHEPQSIEPFVGDYLYIRRARTTMEKMIAVVNRVRITGGEHGSLTMIGASGDPIQLAPIGPRLFRRADHRGVVAFDAVVEGRADRLVAIADSGYPGVYERIPLIMTLRAQLAWVVGMALVFLYAAVWRPLAGVVRRTRRSGVDSRRPSIWLGGIASALNLLCLVGFPLAFLGRMEGGIPEFLYGLPVLAAALLLIPPVTAVMGVAAAISIIRIWRDERTSITARLAHSVVAVALVAFSVFAWYWRLMPTLAS